ncbi:MAG: GntR family transcriptional regulator [Ferruginibacter sp.]
MRNIFEKIQELDGMPSYSKHDQLLYGIMNAIDEKIIVQGDPLPSINAMINELGFARETIMKGYRELVRRGIVESKNRKGYFVANHNTTQELKIALMMYSFDTFQEQFYRSFRNELGANVHLDVFFHHGNIEVFETILSLLKGKFGMYVISPIPHPRSKELLNTIPRNKLLMFDRYEPLEGAFKYVTQEFEKSSYDAFAQLADTIKKFDEMIFFHMPGSPVPIEIVTAFKKFLKDFGIKGCMLPEYIAGSAEKGKVYFTMGNNELWQILKDCKTKGLELGKDVGILSHNDEPVKEIVGDGITTYSTSFSGMGKRAAQAAMSKEQIHEIIPTVLIRRNSL